MARIYKIPLPYLDEIWPTIEKHVARTCEYHPFMEAIDVRAMIETGHLSLFLVTDEHGVLGFGCLEVVQYPRVRVANILAAGGERGFLAVAVRDLLPVMIDYGKTQGATVVALSGRPGWLRALRHLDGGSKRYVTWWADIDGQGRRQFAAPDDHARTVEAGAALPN
jgi:hypothetical protein